MCETNDNSRPLTPARRGEMPPSFVGRARASRAAVLRTVSGQTAGVGVPSRRGSFLILVVGVLALLSVVAVLYATVGTGDRQRSGAVVEKAKMDDYPQRVQEYLAGVIARDALGTMLEVVPGSSPQLANFSRESWDYPFTNWQATNYVGLAGSDSPMFTATGDPLFDANGAVVGGAPMQWVASDPWLAATEPEFLGVNATSVGANKYYVERRDWAHITNAGPDGRFVNLANLRNNFDATSRSLTDNLSIPGRDGTNAPIQTVPGLAFDAPHPLHPAQYDSRQIGAFRPMFDNFPPGDFRNIRNQWADADGDGFADSRWFEMVDASRSDPNNPSLANEFSIIPRDPNIRYFVAARIIDLSGLINVNTASDDMSAPDKNRPIGSSPGEVDLRRLLTMEYQYDQQSVTPSLASSPSAEGYATLSFATDLGAQGTQAVQDYSNYDFAVAQSAATFGYQALKLSLAAGVPVPPRDSLVGDIGSTWAGFNLGTPAAPNDPTFASEYGIVDGLRRQSWDFDTPLANNLLTPAEARYRVYRERQASSSGLFSGQAPPPSPGVPGPFLIANRGVFGEDDLFELLKFHGANDPTVTSALEMVIGGRGEKNLSSPGSGYYADFSPLRDNRALYNERPARLNYAVGNDSQWDQSRLARLFDPRQRLTTFSGGREIRLTSNVTPDRLDNRESRLEPLSMLAAAGHNVATPGTHPVDVAFDSLFGGYLDALAPYITEGNGTTNQNFSWNNSGNATRAAKSQYQFYGNQGPEFAYITSALLAANMVDKFDGDSIPQARTLPLDFDSIADLTADAALPLDQQLFPWWHSAGGDADPMFGDTRPLNTILRDSPGALKMAASSRGDQVHAKAINIFGVEPQVFVTATTAFTVYTDAPQDPSLRGADQENAGDPVTIRGAISIGNTDLVMRVVAFQLTNPFNVDIQLGADELNVKPQPAPNQTVDPYPDRMNLRWLDVADPKFPPITQFHDYFYLEFGGRQYALIRLQEQRVRNVAPPPQNPGDRDDPIQSSGTHGEYTDLPATGIAQGIDTVARPIIVPAGETIVVYALSQSPRQILERMKLVDDHNPVSSFMSLPVTDLELAADPIQSEADSPVITRYRSPYEFHQQIRRLIADRGLGIGRPSTVTKAGDGNFDQDGVYWIPEFFSPVDNATADPAKLGRLGTTTGAPDPAGNRFSPLATTPIESSFADLFTPSSTASSPENQVVKLWRSMRAGINDQTQPDTVTKELKRVPATVGNTVPAMCWNGSTPFTVPAGAKLYADNDRHNDMLVDRLRLPAGTDFNVHTRLENYQPLTATNDIVGTVVNPPTGGIGDDTGLTITLWEAVHRPTDPDATTNSYKSGALPAYCMERKLRSSPGFAGVAWNILEKDEIPDSPAPTLRRRYFQSGTAVHGAGDTLAHWFDRPNRLIPADREKVLIEAVGVAPIERNTPGLGIDAASRINNTPGTGVAKPNFNLDRPELMVDNNFYMPANAVLGDTPHLRTVDMLSPLAVGTIQDPLARNFIFPPPSWNAIPNSGLVVDDIEWTTLSESLCLAEGYETAPNPGLGYAIGALYPTQPDASGTVFKRLYDRAQLKLDDYVPFYDGNNNGVFDPDPTTTTADEYRRGAQTPLAWNVLDVFSVRASSLDSLVPGTVNINTASQSVMACLPMLAPSNLTNDPFLRPARDAWWWPQPTAPATSPTAQSPASDIAATVVASRDKSNVNFRPGSVPAPNWTYASFDEPSFDAVNGYGPLAAREAQTNIIGIGELPGFRTPGSVLMAKANRADSLDPNPVPGADAFTHNIDFLAHDLLAGKPADSSYPGVTPGTTRNWDTTANKWVESPNLAGNDYQEKLAIAGAVLGSTSNRSDIFAAWFIVQGYRSEDVVGLTDDQPMVPSVKRRFVMVVDRSNVRQTGDKPKILLFKEVPVD